MLGCESVLHLAEEEEQHLCRLCSWTGPTIDVTERYLLRREATPSLVVKRWRCEEWRMAMTNMRNSLVRESNWRAKVEDEMREMLGLNQERWEDAIGQDWLLS